METVARGRIRGVLAGYEVGYRAELALLGYTPSSIEWKIDYASQLSRWMTVHGLTPGKGRKHRAVPLTNSSQQVLKTWMTERAGAPNDPVFPTRTGRRLSRDAIGQRLRVHAITAAETCPSLAGKRLHPHVLRHTCAVALLQAGVDTSVIALWLGHADLKSTSPYLHADMTIKEKALAMTAQPTVTPGRYRPSDTVLAFLEGL